MSLPPILQNLEIPNWVKYSLPDALWLFSFTYIIINIWNYKINEHSFFWVFSATLIGIFSEIGQLIELIPGTFDKVDLILLLIAAILPFKSIILLKTIFLLFFISTVHMMIITSQPIQLKRLNLI